MKKLLITGSNGKLSKHIISSLSNDYHIIGCDVQKKSDLKNIVYYRTDVSKLESLNGLVGFLKNNNIMPDILINNAAVDSVPKKNNKSSGFDLEKFDEIFHVNLRAPIFLIKKLSEYWIENNIKGRVINFSSIYSLVSPDPNLYSSDFNKNILYGASKSSLISITKQMATLLIKNNIFINSISFGGVFNNQDENFVNKYSKRLPASRMMSIEEIMPSIHYLLNDKNTYSVGSNIIVDGGYTII